MRRAAARVNAASTKPEGKGCRPGIIAEPLRRARAHRALGRHLTEVSSNEEARAALLRAIDLAREAGDEDEEAKATGALGSLAWNLGDYDEARERHEKEKAGSLHGNTSWSDHAGASERSALWQPGGPAPDPWLCGTGSRRLCPFRASMRFIA